MVVKASRVMNFIFRAFKTKDTHFLVRMFKAYVLPLIDYACVVYQPYTVKNVKLIESVQKRFTKRLPQFFNSRISYAGRLSCLGLDTIEIRMIKFALCEMYKIVYGFRNVNVHEFFTFSNHGHDTRSNGLQVNVDYSESNRRKFFFAVRIPKLWNELPRSVVTSNSLHNFKASLNSPHVMEIFKSFVIGDT